MKINTPKSWAIVALVAALACAVWQLRTGGGAIDGYPATGRDDSSGLSKSARSRRDDRQQWVDGEENRRLTDLAARFAAADSDESRKALYAELDAWFEGLVEREGKDGAAAVLADFLRSGIDAETGAGFAVGRHGQLDLANSMRVYMLDKMLSLNPEKALVLSREVIATHQNQNEYAIALRNLAKQDGEKVSQQEIDSAFTAMMADEQWRKAPQSGFYNSFDMAVGKPSAATVGAVLEQMRNLDAVGSDTRAGLWNATSLALDRVMQTQPELVLEWLVANPNDFLSESAGMRPEVLSRINVTTEIGRKALGTYLNSTTHADGELEEFLERYPNGNYFTGNRLVSQSEIDTEHNIYRTYRKSYEVVEAMGASGEISREHADKLLENLSEYFPSEP